MVKVAIAGGSSPTLGSSIVNVLLATNGRHTPIILSRRNKQPVKDNGATSNVETRYVDYASHASLVDALRDVEVVISVLLIPGPEFVTYQLNLLRAAEEAGCRRFAPSEFALTPEVHEQVDILKAKNVVWNVVRASVDQGKIDAAHFSCGMFMNYLGIGCPISRRDEALAGFREGAYLFHFDDAQNPWVEVPVYEEGSSFPAITMTNIRDVGTFVAAAIDLNEPWAGREFGMVGDAMNFKEIIAICERNIGKRIEVRPVTKSQLAERLEKTPKENFIEVMECQLSMVCSGELSVINPTLNELCPDVKPMKIAEFMEKYWKNGV